MNDIIEKIKKLLRMKRGGTPDEVATALRLAQELADKHNIDLASVNPDEENSNYQKRITHEEMILGARVQWECKFSVLVCKNFFNVEVFITETSWRMSAFTFVGTDWDIAVAKYVYGFLTRHFRYEWKTKRGRCRNRKSFMSGMYVGISSKLRERQPKPIQQPGLVQVDRHLLLRKEYVARNFGPMETSKIGDDSEADAAFRRGYVAGRETEIRGGLSGGPTPKPKQLPTARSQQSLLGL